MIVLAAFRGLTTNFCRKNNRRLSVRVKYSNDKKYKTENFYETSGLRVADLISKNYLHKKHKTFLSEGKTRRRKPITKYNMLKDESDLKNKKM